MSMGTDTPLGNPLFARVDASFGSGARVVNVLPFPNREGAEFSVGPISGVPSGIGRLHKW